MENTERFFSVELKSKTHLKDLTLANGSQDGVLIEGTLGALMAASFVEDELLEIVGNKGTLRINLKDSELTKTQPKGASVEVNV